MSATRPSHPAPRVSLLTWAVGRAFLRVVGWEVTGEVPAVGKAVLIAAPHTSNWDFVYGLPATWALRLKVQWLGKHTLFAGPVRGPVMRWLGGVSVDRRGRRGLVSQVVRKFNERDQLVLIVPPSGTRQAVDHWKSGFYHIAHGAGVPVICGYVDYRRKQAGLGPCFQLTGDVSADMERIRAFYEGIEGKHPERAQAVRLREEGA